MDELQAKKIARRILGVPFMVGDRVRKIASPGIGYEGVVIKVIPTGIEVRITMLSPKDYGFNDEKSKIVGEIKGGSIFAHYKLIG